MNTRPACKINDLNYPASDKITSRISTLCRSMACTLMKREACSPQVEKEWMQFFPDKTCAYCGKPATHLDHLYPMINNSRPTGYGTEPGNLVPCCKDCNTPKGNMHWEDFMKHGNCKHIGTSKNNDPKDAMQERINIIKDFQATIPAQHVNIDLSLMTDWDQLLANLQQALDDTEKKLKIMNAQLNKTQSQISSVKIIKTQQQINNGNRFTSGLNTPTITEEQKLKIAADYLRNGISFVKLDEKYFGIDNRHGNKCWGILDNLGIRKNQKGLLKNSNIDTEISKSSGVLKETLIKIKAKGL